MSAPPLSFTLIRPTFACPALLTAAARAPMGGERETLLAVLMAVRLVSGLCPRQTLPGATRLARAEAGRAWLASVTLSPRIRTAVQRCLASSATGSPAGAAEALHALVELVADLLDRGTRRQLAHLLTTLETAPDALLPPPSAP